MELSVLGCNNSAMKIKQNRYVCASQDHWYIMPTYKIHKIESNVKLKQVVQIFP